MAEWQTAGKVRMTPKGVYSSASAYEVLDVVSNADQTISYIAKKDVPAGTSLSNTEYWSVMIDGASSVGGLDTITINDRDGVVSSYFSNPLPLFIRNTNVWHEANNGKHYMIPISPGDNIVVRAKLAEQTQYAVLRSFDHPIAGETPDFSTETGFTERITVLKDTYSSFTAPSDAAYLCVNGTYSTYDYTPESVTVNGVEMFRGVRSHIANLQNRQGIFQSLSLRQIKQMDSYYDAAGHKYQAQSIAVTDDYIVIGMNSVDTTEFPSAFDKYNAYLALDKTTLEPANISPNPVIIDFENGNYTIDSSHANNMSFVASSNELWIRSTVNRMAVVLDADTLALKTITQMPYSGSFGYDNQNGKWCFFQDLSTDSNKYYIRIFESTLTTQIGALTIWKQGTTQGGAFHDNAVFVPNSSVGNRPRGESIMMIDASTGAILADWWFSDFDEFEDISFMDDQIVLLTARGDGLSILIGNYKPYNQHANNLQSYAYPWNSDLALPVGTGRVVSIMATQPEIEWTIGKTVGANTGSFNDPYPTGATTNEIFVNGGDVVVSNTSLKDSNDVVLNVHLCQYANGVFQSRTMLIYNKPVVLNANTTSIRLNFLRAASTNVNMTSTDIEKYFGVSFYRRTMSYAEYKRDSEEIETHTDTIGPLINIAETWFNVAYDPNDQIVYETQHGPYSTLRDANDKKAIVCSQFALACLSGLSYERSRYVQNNNAFCWWGYHSDGTGTYPYDNDYMINQYWVQYLADKGLLIPYVAGHHNIKAGDLLFYGDDIEHNGGHCRICTQVNPYQLMTMESTGDQTRLIDSASVGLIARGINLNTNPPVYYVHMPIAPTNYTTKRILLDTTHQTGSAEGVSGVSSAAIKKYEFAPTLEQGFYSLVIDREESGTAGVYARAYYQNGATENILFGTNESFGGTIRNTFYAQMPMVGLMVRCAFDSGSAYSYDITRVALYRGWHE